MAKTATITANRGRKTAQPDKTELPKRPKNAPAGTVLEAKPVTSKPSALIPEHCPIPQTVLIRLKCYRPEAREVFVAGAFNDWRPQATPLLPIPDGDWVVDLALTPGRYEYRYVADGQWIDDPMADGFVANPFGGHNAVLEIPPKS